MTHARLRLLISAFSCSPRRRFVFQTEISGKHIVLVLISRLFYFLSSLYLGGQSTVFCIVSFNQSFAKNLVGGLQAQSCFSSANYFNLQTV